MGVEDDEGKAIQDAMTGDDGDRSETRGYKFQMRLSEVEHQQLIHHAAEWAVRQGLSGDPQGMNLSKYARETLLAPHAEDQAVTRAELIDFRDKASRLTLQIARVGVNINQIALVANAKGVVLDRETTRLVEQMKPLLDEANDLIHAMFEKNL
ncbi:hypothetical protein BPY_18740 [Bifidobacterium psychraerophilum]|uniref:plasmid mobilization relaxosome protein MobC n=1 Tax=Bifidobacterium psychraerophilum TaxID=218140 RepID=UPI003110F902